MWYHLFYPSEYGTPEQQAEAFRLIEKFQELIDTNRFDAEGVRWLYIHQTRLFSSLVFADIRHIPKLQAYLAAVENRNPPQRNETLFSGYRDIWRYKLGDFSKDGGSDEDLTLIFDTMLKFLDVGSDNYDNAGSWLRGTLFLRPMPFEQCTPQQQELFLNRWEQVLAKMEAIEKPWKEAGKRMDKESYVTELRSYLDLLRLPGTVVALTGQTVDGEAFDIEQYRGKVVVLHFWASWCGPCIRQIPGLKELYAKYHDRGFEVLGISYETDPEKVQPFIERHELPWLSLFDKNWKILNRFSHGNSTLSVLIDREGKAIFYTGDEELRAKLAELFE
jgi:peroxiredoxin